MLVVNSGVAAMAFRRRRHTVRYNQTPQPTRQRKRAMPLILYLFSAALTSLVLFSMARWFG
jgi:hypothetical protein